MTLYFRSKTNVGRVDECRPIYVDRWKVSINSVLLDVLLRARLHAPHFCNLDMPIGQP